MEARRSTYAPSRGALAVALLLLAPASLPAVSTGCSRRASSASPGADASTPPLLAVRVPAGLTLSRALDTLSVAVDPGSLALTQVAADAGRTLGVEWNLVVFARGQPRPSEGRHGVSSTTDFDAATSTWSTARDGLPVPGLEYVAEMQLILFQTDVAPAPGWDPHAGRYRVLWTRTLVQAEE
jgi:hypothetical protein